MYPVPTLKLGLAFNEVILSSCKKHLKNTYNSQCLLRYKQDISCKFLLSFIQKPVLKFFLCKEKIRFAFIWTSSYQFLTLYLQRGEILAHKMHSAIHCHVGRKTKYKLSPPCKTAQSRTIWPLIFILLLSRSKIFFNKIHSKWQNC